MGYLRLHESYRHSNLQLILHNLIPPPGRSTGREWPRFCEQAKITDLQGCTPDSTDANCKNADKKIALLQKVDTRLQAAMQKVQDWLNGHGSPSSDGSTDDSALDQAAQDLGRVAGG